MSKGAAATATLSPLRWPILAVALFIAFESAHTTITDFLLAPAARIGFFLGIGVAAIASVIVLRLEETYLRRARAALPYGELRRHPAPTAGRLFRSLLFRWSVVFWISVASVEYVLTIAELNPGAGALGSFIALALVATALAVRRGVLGSRGELVETPDLSPVRSIALSQPVRVCGSIVFVWTLWSFALLVFTAGWLTLLK